MHVQLSLNKHLLLVHSLDDVEAKLTETEREAEKARKESKKARDEFSSLKKKR